VEKPLLSIIKPEQGEKGAVDQAAETIVEFGMLGQLGLVHRGLQDEKGAQCASHACEGWR